MATDGDSFLTGKVSQFFVDDVMKRDTGWRRLLQVVFSCCYSVINRLYIIE